MNRQPFVCALPAFVLLLAVVLAGCSDGGGDSTDVPSASTATSASVAPLAVDPAPIGVTVDPPAPTQTETATVTGSVNHAALVSIDGGPSVDVPAGRWSLTTQGLDFGRTPSVVRVSDGVHSVSANVTFVRLAPFTLEVQYGHYPGLTDSSTELWMDPETFPSAPAYEGKPAPHPTFANVHDVTVVWAAATGAELELAWSDVVDGYSVSKINGAGNPVDSSIPPYWLLEVNGETADFGMTLMPAVPGDHIAWCLNACGA